MTEERKRACSRFPPLYAISPRRCCSRQTGAIVIDHYGNGVNPYSTTTTTASTNNNNNEPHRGVNASFLLSASSSMKLGSFLPLVSTSDDVRMRGAMDLSSSELVHTFSSTQLRELGFADTLSPSSRCVVPASPRNAYPLLREGRVVRRVRQRIEAKGLGGASLEDGGSGLSAFYANRARVPSLEASRAAFRNDDVNVPGHDNAEGVNDVLSLSSRKLLAVLDEVTRRMDHEFQHQHVDGDVHGENAVA